MIQGSQQKGEKEGLFEWLVEVEAGEELMIETEWDINASSIMHQDPVSLGCLLGWFEKVRNRVRDWLR